MRGRLVRRVELTPGERASMLRLLEAHFEGVTTPVFERDLAAKDWVLLLEQAGELRGFSTLLIYEKHFGDETATIVYSGDTIVEPGARGSSALSRCWIGSVRALRQLHPRGRLYWLLLTSGFRTYRFLPVFWRDFHPRCDTETHPELGSRLALLAAERFGARYLPQPGIVRFESPQVLRDGLAGVPPAKLQDPHVAFFLERNPGWIHGDELACLTEISFENLTVAGRRMWRESERTLLLPQVTS